VNNFLIGEVQLRGTSQTALAQHRSGDPQSGGEPTPAAKTTRRLNINSRGWSFVFARPSSGPTVFEAASIPPHEMSGS